MLRSLGSAVVRTAREARLIPTSATNPRAAPRRSFAVGSLRKARAARQGPGARGDADAKSAALSQALDSINARFGKNSVVQLGQSPSEDVRTTPTGALTLDVALGGGFPVGRIVEIYGPESSGKTTVALHAIAEVQKRGGTAVLIDAEHAFDARFASKLGVDVGSLLVSQPDCGEAALEIADSLIRSAAVDLVAIDSVAALVPRSEIEGEIGQLVVGAQARMMSGALRKLAGNAAAHGTSLLFLNQLRHKVGVIYGSPEVTAGGQALKYYASCRIEVRVREKLGPAGAQTGVRVRARVTKNKVAPPYREAAFDILFGSGIDSRGCLLDAAEAAGVVVRKGAWYYYPRPAAAAPEADAAGSAGEAAEPTREGSARAASAPAAEVRLGQGRDRALEFLASDPSLQAEIDAATRLAIGAIDPFASVFGESDLSEEDDFTSPEAAHDAERGPEPALAAA